MRTILSILLILVVELFTERAAHAQIAYSETNDTSRKCAQMAAPHDQATGCATHVNGESKYIAFSGTGADNWPRLFGPYWSGPSSGGCGREVRGAGPGPLTEAESAWRCNDARAAYLNNHFACTNSTSPMTLVKKVATANPAATDEVCKNMGEISRKPALRNVWACVKSVDYPNWLASISTHTVSVSRGSQADQFVLAFDTPHAQITAFTDRPYRRSEHLRFDDFITHWNEVFPQNANQAPNVEIALDGADYVGGVVVEQWTDASQRKFYLRFNKAPGENDLVLGSHDTSHVFIDRIDNLSDRYHLDDNLPSSQPHQAGGRTEERSALLFAFSADKAKVYLAKDVGLPDGHGGRLVLTGTSALTHAFKAHPERGSTSTSTEAFIRVVWPLIFKNLPPNAVVSGETANGEIRDFVVTLSNPSFESGRAVFDVKLLDANYTLEDIRNVHIYVDSFWGFLRAVAAITTAGAVCSASAASIAATLGTSVIVAGPACFTVLTGIWANYELSGSPTVIDSPVNVNPLDTKHYLASQQGKSWSLSTNNFLPNRPANDWLLATPMIPDGQRYDDWIQPVTCTSGERCNTQFGRQTCLVDTDCKPSRGRGKCLAFRSSVARPGNQPLKMCAGHSDRIVETFYDTMVKAEKYIDLAHLGALSPGPWNAALQNAISFVSHNPDGKRPIVRSFMGITTPNDTGRYPKLPWYQFCRAKVTNEFSNLTSVVPADKKEKLQIYVGYGVTDAIKFSWNHSKILAVDGKYLITGGHNWLSDRYLEQLPVFDMSLQMKGDATEMAHIFLNRLWDYHVANFTQNSASPGSNAWCQRQIAYGPNPNAEYNKQSFLAVYVPFNSVTHKQPLTSAEKSTSDNVATVKTLALANLAAIEPDGAGDSITRAVRTMVQASKETIYMSQQDLGPYKVNPPGDYFPKIDWEAAGWPTDLFVELGKALKRNVNAHIVLSTPGAANQYSNEYSLLRVKGELFRALRSQGGFGTDQVIKELVCDRFHLYTIRYSKTESAYMLDGKPNVPNHAKSVMVDNRWTLIGSHNLYMHHLQEFAVLMDSTTVAQAQYQSYWRNLLEQSKPSCVSGSQCTSVVSRNTCLQSSQWE